MRVSTRRAWWSALAMTALALGALAPPAGAQYFGRNKVQYRSFDVRVLRTEHFDIYFYPEEREAARQAGRMGERWYARLAKLFDHQLTGRQPLILYASHPDFEQTTVLGGELSEGTGGVTEMSKRRIVLPLAASLAETDHVIGHELVHAFQFDIARQGRSGSGFLEQQGLRMPLWFVEGMAEYLSIGPIDANTAMWMRDAVERNKIPKISQLDNPDYFPYRYGEAFWAYVAGRWGDYAVGRILKAAGRATDVEAAIASVTGVKTDTLSREWHEALRAWNGPIAKVTEGPEKSAKVLETESHGIGRYNVSPALSPDGTRMVFLSERDLFSIEAYLADARTGKVIRKITRTAVDPHYESLEFIQSAGSFSPDGRRFAFSAVAKSHPVLSVMEIGSGRIVRELAFPDLGEVFSPSWSPDGSEIAFSAQAGGLTDLFVVNVASGARRRLTHDLYADLEPSWSPDGKHIAFVTDRFGTRVDSLEYGAPRLALIDPAGGEPTPLSTFDDGKAVDPQWAPDGRSLYFVSDRGGISNVYRLSLDGGTPRQVTNLRTGVSGITPLGPAISVARESGRLVYTAYVGGHFALYSLDSPDALAGIEPVATPSAAAMPPVERKDSMLPELQNDPQFGLVAEATLDEKPYRAKLSIDHVSQLGLGVGTGAGGTSVGGGTTLFWSDMLGRHQLATLLQISNYGGDFSNNIAGVLAYQNLKSRWNWGVAGSQIPYLTRNILVSEGLFGSEPATQEQDFRFWQIDRELGGSVQYPFSRVQRIELGAGFRQIAYKSEIQTRIWSDITGNLLFDHTAANDSFPTINLATASAALVYDNSVFGGTSPILGQRYRLEADPVVGDLHFVGLLGDYRRYVMVARPVNVAARVLTYGRYGRDSDDPRLGAVFAGDPWLIRGYDVDSFTNAEFSAAGNGSVDAIDRLLGSRIGITNLELRLPLIGPAGLVRSVIFPPIEAAGFFDAGVGWDDSVKPTFLGGSREPVTSHGVALRVNLFGIVIGEADLVHPNDRPLKGWYWQFNLQPGF